MSVLTQASNQWATRPADERFNSVADWDARANEWRAMAREKSGVPYSDLRTQAQDGEVVLMGKQDIPASFTHWSFGQLARNIGAPAQYLRELPPTLAAQNLNHGLAKMGNASNTNLYLHKNGSYQVSAFLSDSYTRIFNSDVTGRIKRLISDNPEWNPAPAAFDGSRGMYLSDHDLFGFFVDNDRRIFETAPGGGLGRGFFVWNSEVGAASFGIMTFYYEFVCGNHRVWGASGVQELRIKHVGNADDRAFGQLEGELRKYADSSAAGDEAKVESARKMLLGSSKDEVLDKVFAMRIPVLSRKLLTDGYEKAEQRRDWYGDPRSVWGLTGGITEIARDVKHADRRLEIDRAAGKVLQVAF